MVFVDGKLYKKSSDRQYVNEHIYLYFNETLFVKKMLGWICPESHSLLIPYLAECARRNLVNTCWIIDKDFDLRNPFPDFPAV